MNAPAALQPEPASSAPGAELSVFRRLSIVAGDIKLAHTVFAMPFALLGAFLARASESSWSGFGGQVALIVLCMVIARTWAMVVNRLADRGIDAANPRTARRAFASGRLSPRFGTAVLVACVLAFVAACAGFLLFFDNSWPLYLSLPVLAFLALYSFTKRLTWLCHLYLGIALAISPLAAAIAIDPTSLSRTPALFWTSGMVAAWVAGFDVIYALQDVEMDRRDGLWSVPSRLGTDVALWISRALHVVAFACIAMSSRADDRYGWIFLVALLPVATLLVIEHVVLARRGKAGLDLAFFTLNGIVSCVLGFAGCVDLAL